MRELQKDLLLQDSRKEQNSDHALEQQRTTRLEGAMNGNMKISWAPYGMNVRSPEEKIDIAAGECVE